MSGKNFYVKVGTFSIAKSGENSIAIDKYFPRTFIMAIRVYFSSPGGIIVLSWAYPLSDRSQGRMRAGEDFKLC